ncbi:MAG: DUF4349 domain-containing protein [Agathobacter sp.]|nr:DUF4349 domain-containing protein [Agathobacter sp.]
MKRRTNWFTFIAVIIGVMLFFTGCGGAGMVADENKDFAENPSSNPSDDSFFEGSSPEKEETEEDSSSIVYDERKIVYTVTTELQTKNFDAAMESLQKGIQTNKGFIQSQKETNDSGINSKYSRRTVTMVVRIPSANLNDFLSGLKNDNMHTLSLSKDSQDLTSAYYDKEIRIESLKIQEERLLDMLSKATDLNTMLSLEDRLTDVRYEIESLTKELNLIDSNVAYSTVTIYMSEVVEYNELAEEPATFGERFAEAIKESWQSFFEGAQDFAIWFIYTIPTLLVLAVIALAIIFFIRGLRKRHKRRQLERQKATQVPPMPGDSPFENENN